jgi:hypothetical protein
MRTTSTNRVRLGAVALCALLFTAGCDFNAAQEAFDNLAIILELDEIETTASGQLLDARTGELINARATVSFAGPNAADVVDTFNDPIDFMEASGGLASFGLRNDLTPTEASPADLTVLVEAPGYLPGVAKLRVTEDATDNGFTVRMMRRSPSDAPAGTTTRRQDTGSASQGGATSETIQVQVSDNSSGADASVTIPAGSVLETATGRALSGQLTTSMTYFNNNERDALLALPSGYTETASGQKLTLGFALNVTVSDPDGNVAATFGGSGKRQSGSSLTVDVTGLADPATGEEVEAGDKLRLLFWNGTTSGAWRDVTGTEEVDVVDDGAGGLEVSFTLPTAGGFYAFGFPVPTGIGCDVAGTFTVNGNGRTGSFTATLIGNGNAYEKTINLPTGTGTRNFADVFPEASGVDAASYALTIRKGATSISDVAVNICSGTPSLTLPPVPTSATDVRIEVVPECDDPGTSNVETANVTTIPTLTIFYRPSGSPSGTPWVNGGNPQWERNSENPSEWKYIERGYLDLDQVETGIDYDFFTTFDGDRYEEQGRRVLGSGSAGARTEDGRVVTTYDIERSDLSDICG